MITPLAIVVQALTESLDVPVSTIMPTDRPPQHVIVSRIGSSEPTFGTSVSRFLIECFATSQLEAEQLGEQDRKSTRLNSSHRIQSRMPSSA